MGGNGSLACLVLASCSRHQGAPSPTTRAQPTRTISAVESGLLPWHLPVPVSRAAVVAAPANHVIILGGLEPSGAYSNAAFELDTANGALQLIGTLPSPVHDGGGGSVGGSYVFFGGGAPITDNIVEGVQSPGTSTGHQLGRLHGFGPERSRMDRPSDGPGPADRFRARNR